MSVVTDMIIITDCDETESMELVNAWCAENDVERHQQFNELNTDAAGGTKYLGSRIWATGGNFFPYMDLVQVFHTFNWRNPTSVVLIINHEDKEYTQVVFPQR
jgi:hypothetical protein